MSTAERVRTAPFVSRASIRSSDRGFASELRSRARGATTRNTGDVSRRSNEAMRRKSAPKPTGRRTVRCSSPRRAVDRPFSGLPISGSFSESTPNGGARRAGSGPEPRRLRRRSSAWRRPRSGCQVASRRRQGAWRADRRRAPVRRASGGTHRRGQHPPAHRRRDGIRALAEDGRDVWVVDRDRQNLDAYADEVLGHVERGLVCLGFRLDPEDDDAAGAREKVVDVRGGFEEASSGHGFSSYATSALELHLATKRRVAIAGLTHRRVT